MTSILANSALTFEIYFSSGGVILFLVLFAIYQLVFAIIAGSEGEEGSSIVSTLVCILSIAAIAGVAFYTNGYLSGLG